MQLTSVGGIFGGEDEDSSCFGRGANHYHSSNVKCKYTLTLVLQE